MIINTNLNFIVIKFTIEFFANSVYNQIGKTLM